MVFLSTCKQRFSNNKRLNGNSGLGRNYRIFLSQQDFGTGYPQMLHVWLQSERWDSSTGSQQWVLKCESLKCYMCDWKFSLHWFPPVTNTLQELGHYSQFWNVSPWNVTHVFARWILLSNIDCTVRVHCNTTLSYVFIPVMKIWN